MCFGSSSDWLWQAEPAVAQWRLIAMDADLQNLTKDELIAEVMRLRSGIRAHRDASGHALCWHHPQLWGLLPEPIRRDIAVPEWPVFLRGCVKYREALDRELPDAPRTFTELTNPRS
jgi:hypothetical protein